MREFKDRFGKVWRVEMTLGSLRTFQGYSSFHFDLLHPLGSPEFYSLKYRADKNSLFIFDMIAKLCEESIKENGYEGLEDAELLNLFDPESFRAAHEAFFDEYVEFLTKLGLPGVAAAVRAIQASLRADDSALLEKVGTTPVERLLRYDCDQD